MYSLVYDKKTRKRELGGGISSWEQLDESSRTAFKDEWSAFVLKWATDNLQNGEVQRMTPAERNEAVLAAYKARPGADPLPQYVEDFLRGTYFDYLTLVPLTNFYRRPNRNFLRPNSIAPKPPSFFPPIPPPPTAFSIIGPAKINPTTTIKIIATQLN